MDEFMAAFEKQLELGVNEYIFNFNCGNDHINQKFFAEPFLSCFCYDCIGRGLDINGGGSLYPSVHGAAVMGIGTVSDSLAAIEKVVFTDREATLTQLRDAMNANFEGYEELRKKLLSAPKYGNNDNFVDKYAVWFIDYLGSLFEKKKTRDGGGIYIAAAANISNIHAGRSINATPDGRLRGEPLSDAASPAYGRDTRGATSTVNSVSKPDYTKVACGSVVNQKFSPSMFTPEKRKKLMALIKTYFKKGGQELQINATSREILLDAMEHPEKYQNLVVRVSGFSAFYVTLEKDVQLDILNRTQQE
jgi:formate C-acetyltransferase